MFDGLQAQINGSKQTIKKVEKQQDSLLDEIEGIGTVRKRQLIKEFGSVSKMREATVEDIAKIVPLNVAQELKDYLDSKYKEE